MTDLIRLPVWRLKEEVLDWDAKSNKRGPTAKLLTATYTFTRLGVRARSLAIPQPFVRLTISLGRGEGFYNTLRIWNQEHVFKRSEHNCTAARMDHMPPTIRRKANAGQIDGSEFLTRCNETIVCDATLLCPKICTNGSDIALKASHSKYNSCLVPQQCDATPHGGSDDYCRHHTVMVADGLPHSVKAAKNVTFGAAARTRSLALRRKAMKAAITQEDGYMGRFTPLTQKESHLAKEFNDKELLETLSIGMEMNVEGGIGAEDVIELDKTNSTLHYGCITCCEFYLVPCGVCVSHGTHYTTRRARLKSLSGFLSRSPVSGRTKS